MSDKLERGIAVAVGFVDGEAPTAAKFSAISSQMLNAADNIERAIGDVHDQSYPYSSATTSRLSLEYGRLTPDAGVSGAETRTLDIVNIARLIGPASNLNPPLLPGTYSVTEAVPAGVYEFSLNFPPDDPTAVTFSDSGAGRPFYTQETDPQNLDAAGDYYVDSYGRVFLTQATDSTAPGTATYTITPSSWYGGSTYMGATFNVIPDPNQLSTGGTGLSISAPDASGNRTVTLPTVEAAQYNEALSGASLGDEDPIYGEQLELPKVLTLNYTAGDRIPDGFLILKNWTTGEVYDQAEYYYNDASSFLINGADLTDAITRGDKFVVITVGTDVTSSIDDLRRKSRHKHDRHFGEPLVAADALSGWTTGPWGSAGSFTASNIEGNFAPQYLHRYGYQATENGWNDYNIMRGDLVIGRSGVAEGEHFDSTGVSYRLYFGDTSGPSLYNSSGAGYFEGNGIHIESSSTDVSVVSANEINLTPTTKIDVTGYMEVKQGTTLSAGYAVDNAGLLFASAAGNIDCTYGAIGSDSLIVGPLNSWYGSDALTIWAIDENGSTDSGTSTGSGTGHWATTTTTGSYDSGGWVVPAVQILHYAQYDRDFSAYDSTGAAATQWQNVSFIQSNIKLPDYLFNKFSDNLGGAAVLGYTVMVKSPASGVGGRWWTVGAGRYGSGSTEQAERIISFLDFDYSTASNNEIQIIIATDGNSNNNFHWTRLRDVAAALDTDPPSDTNGALSVDVKIVLFVAAPTDSIPTVPNVVI